MTNTPNDSSLKEKVFGCLLGVAIEDTLGAPIEHLLPDETARMRLKSPVSCKCTCRFRQTERGREQWLIGIPLRGCG